MSDRPKGSPEQAEHDQKTAGTDPAYNNPLGPTSQAESGHGPDDGKSPENHPVTELKAEIEVLKTEHQALHDKYLRLYSDFENFRKRTAKERMDLLQNAAADTLKNMLPVMDDMERARVNNETLDDLETMRNAFVLIEQKMRHILGMQGLKPMESMGKDFDVDHHEAIARAAAPKKKLKGKVIDVIEPGYFLNDKVLRYAKVVVGE